MHVDLADDIAERADIDFVRPGVSLEKARGVSRLLDQLRPIAGVEVGKLNQPVAPRDQDESGPAGVVHQQDARERHVADNERIAGESFVERKAHAHQTSLAPLAGRGPG
jgi:hypothetical protein